MICHHVERHYEFDLSRFIFEPLRHKETEEILAEMLMSIQNAELPIAECSITIF